MAMSKQGSTQYYDHELIRTCLLLLAMWRKLYGIICSSMPHLLTAALDCISSGILFFISPFFTFLRLQPEREIMLRAWCECCQIVCYGCSQPQKSSVLILVTATSNGIIKKQGETCSYVWSLRSCWIHAYCSKVTGTQTTLRVMLKEAALIT